MWFLYSYGIFFHDSSCNSFQGQYGGCFSNPYNANKRTWYMSCAANRRMLFLLHENKQCLHSDCCQQQCKCSLCFQVCCWGCRILSFMLCGNIFFFFNQLTGNWYLILFVCRRSHCLNLILVGLLMKMRFAIILFSFMSC